MNDDLMNDFLVEAFPNPERKGCPDENTLRALAQAGLATDPTAGLHVGSCSECYTEYRCYRADWEESKRTDNPSPVLSTEPALIPPSTRAASPFKAVRLALAASLLITASMGGFIAYRHSRPLAVSTTQVASRDSVTAKVDLFEAATLRGSGDEPAPLQQVILPAAIVHLAITLPRFSHSGHYSISVSKDRAGKQMVAEGQGTAIEADGKVGVGITLDLRAAAPGSYFLATVRGSDNGAYYYPLEVR